MNNKITKEKKKQTHKKEKHGIFKTYIKEYLIIQAKLLSNTVYRAVSFKSLPKYTKY